MRITAILLLLLILVPLNAFAQAHTQWNLPEGARGRLGKGTINNIRHLSKMGP